MHNFHCIEWHHSFRTEQSGYMYLLDVYISRNNIRLSITAKWQYCKGKIIMVNNDDNLRCLQCSYLDCFSVVSPTPMHTVTSKEIHACTPEECAHRTLFYIFPLGLFYGTGTILWIPRDCLSASETSPKNIGKYYSIFAYYDDTNKLKPKQQNHMHTQLDIPPNL